MSAIRNFFLRVLALAGKEVLHVRRDPRTLVLALVMPVLLLLLFGYGISFDIEAIPVMLVDQDGTVESRRLAREMFASDELRLAGRLSDPSEIEASFRRGAAVAAVVIPRGYGRSVARGEPVDLQLMVNAADGNTAIQTVAKADAIAQAVAVELGGGLRLGSGGPPLSVRVFTYFNPQGRSAFYLVPGITAYIVAIVAVLLTALTVAREWEQGSMEQLFATPVARLEIVIGKLMPYLVLGSLAVLLVLAVGAWVFDVPLRGDPSVLVVASLLFLLGMLGQGLLVSVLTRNQLVATQAATMSSMLPSMLLSGFIFPIENMPEVLQWITVVIPARYFIETLRGVLLRGNGFTELWPQLVALAAFALVMVTVSTARFRRRLA